MHALKAWIGLSIFFSCGIADNWAADPEVRFNLLTLPSARQAELRLVMPAHLNYEHAPLRLCVEQLAEHFQVSYWIDRRVDADKPVTLNIAEGTLGECLSKLARACNAEVGLVENVVTIAHPEHLADMQYAAVRLHNQLSTAQADDAQLRPLAWPKLTTPSELAQQINSTWGLSITSDLPHDLMNAGSLQPCTLSTQLTLLYGGFGKCAAGKRAGELRVLPMPKSGNWQAEYTSSAISADQVSLVKGMFTSVQAEKAKNSWRVVGPTAAHLMLLQPKRAAEPSNRSNRSANQNSTGEDPLGKQRFDIGKQSDKPLGAILKSLADQLGLSVQWDEGLPPSAPFTLVTIEAKKAKLDEILANLAQQAKVSIKRSGTQITVER